MVVRGKPRGRIGWAQARVSNDRGKALLADVLYRTAFCGATLIQHLEVGTVENLGLQ